MTPIQLTPWLQLAEAIAAISVPAILGYVATYAKAHFKLAAGSSAATILNLLVTSSSQAVVSAIAKAPATANPLEIQNAVVGGILSDLSASTQAAMALKNVTAATIAARIDGAVQMALPPLAPAAPPLGGVSKP